MSSNLVNTHANALLDYSLGTAYLALLSAVASASSAGTELAGNGYARQLISFGAAASEQKVSNADVVFPTVTTADWLTIVGWGIYDAVTSGNRLWWFTLAAGDQRTPRVGDVYKVPSTDITIQLA